MKGTNEILEELIKKRNDTQTDLELLQVEITAERRRVNGPSGKEQIDHLKKQVSKLKESNKILRGLTGAIENANGTTYRAFGEKIGVTQPTARDIVECEFRRVKRLATYADINLDEPEDLEYELWYDATVVKVNRIEYKELNGYIRDMTKDAWDGGREEREKHKNP